MKQEELAKLFIKSHTTNPESKGRFKHLLYCPFTGLGLYNGFRGNRWLKNRIQIFKQFVLPSLVAQTSQNFTLWVSWRREEQSNPIVKDFVKFMSTQPFEVVHTYTGVCFWDDKYPDNVARERLLTSIHGAMATLIDVTTGEYGYEWVYMTLQPSDDCYHKETVKAIQTVFAETDLQAVGFKKGYVMNHQSLDVREWNPNTNPPFFTIKFPRPVFIDPLKHADYTGPYKSHEYIGEKLKYGTFDVRGFLVGTHGENISTVFNHPFTGEKVDDVLQDFGLENVKPLVLPFSLRRTIFKGLPHSIQRKLRYWAGEKKWILRPLFNYIYNGLRS